MVPNRPYWVQKIEGTGRNGPQSPLLGTKIEGKGTNLFSIAFIEYKKRGKRVEISPQSLLLGTKNRRKRPKWSSIALIEYKKMREKAEMVLNPPIDGQNLTKSTKPVANRP